MGRITQFRNPKLSLWQAAVTEVVAKRQAHRTLGLGAAIVGGDRPSTDDPLVHSVTAFCEQVTGTKTTIGPPTTAPRAIPGVSDIATYCSNVALKLAEGLGRALLTGDTTEIQIARQQLGQFTDCDPRYAEAALKYADYFVLQHKTIPYRRHSTPDQFVIENKLPANARVAILGDWGTGQESAKQVLRQIAARSPDVVIHLGDVYYAGTQFEVENYFLSPWEDILHLSPTVSRPATYTLSGNHDMYCGGEPYYRLIDHLGQPASYFSLRNGNWQFLAMDTGLHDSNPVGEEPTMLDESEAAWLRGVINNSGGRRTVLLSHHQLFSTYESIGGNAVNPNLYKQLKDALSGVALWFWGHEHNLVIYEKYLGILGRCIGHGAFPIGVDEIPAQPLFPHVPVKPIRLSKGPALYNHGYAMMELSGPNAQVSYYQDTNTETPLFREQL